MAALGAPARRVLVSHGLAALAVALPWPLLLVLTDQRTHSAALVGAVGASRMLPYVLLSWATSRLADVLPRDLIVRLSLLARVALLLVWAGATVTGRLWVAVAAATLAVAASTPAYPAQAAAMPGVAGARCRPATDLLVTVEVAAFVVGASLGGLLLQPGTRALLPWAPVAMTLVALVVVLPVPMPAPGRSGSARDRTGRGSSPAVLHALRRSPEALGAVAVMAVVNLVLALVALALLPLAREHWSSDDSGYGVATGVLGCAALAAPLLRRLAPTARRAVPRGMCLFALALVLVAPAPSVSWSLLPLGLAGATAVSIEAAATGVLQECLSDDLRASVLGLNDSVIVAAALLGSLVGPLSVELLGGPAVLGASAALVLAAGWWLRPGTVLQPHSHLLATVGVTREEPDAQPLSLTTPSSAAGAARIPAPRRPDDGPRGLWWGEREQPGLAPVGPVELAGAAGGGADVRRPG